jgi:hypothetical protein
MAPKSYLLTAPAPPGIDASLLHPMAEPFRGKFQSPRSRLPTDGLGISNSFIPTSWIGGQWLFFHTLFMYARPATRFRCCVVYCKGYVKNFQLHASQHARPRTLKQLHTNTTTELFCLRIATLGLEAKTPTATPHDQDPSPFLVLQWRKEQLHSSIPFRSLACYVHLPCICGYRANNAACACAVARQSRHRIPWPIIEARLLSLQAPDLPRIEERILPLHRAWRGWLKSPITK